jgi:hypothetical protein
MRKPFPWCGLLLLLTATGSVIADDKPDPKDKPDPPAEKYQRIGAVSGVVQNVPGEDGVLKIKVTLRYLEPNVQAEANLVREEQNLMARQAAALQIRNPIQRQQEFLRIYQAAQNLGRENLFTLKGVQKDLEFEAVDETKYRATAPPIAFDDKGEPKKYTREELKELKGTDHLPGYAVERASLHSGQAVVVTAARRKPAPGEKEIAEEKPVATVILIIGEP